MSYRSDDPADNADADHDYFATQAMNASPEEEDAVYARYLRMSYELPADEEEAVARMSVEDLNAIVAHSNGKHFTFMTPYEYALRFAAKMALEEHDSTEEDSCSRCA